MSHLFSYVRHVKEKRLVLWSVLKQMVFFFCILHSWGFLHLNDMSMEVPVVKPAHHESRIQGEEDEEEPDGGCLHYEAQKSGRLRHPTGLRGVPQSIV